MVNMAEQRKKFYKDLRGMLDSQDTIRTMAYAGTGKTTKMCRRKNAIKFLLVDLNKSVDGAPQ